MYPTKKCKSIMTTFSRMFLSSARINTARSKRWTCATISAITWSEMFTSNFAEKKMLKRRSTTWTIVGLAAGRFTPSFHLSLISVRPVVVSMKWGNYELIRIQSVTNRHEIIYKNCVRLASARVPDFVTSCTWSPSPGSSADIYTVGRRARVVRDRDQDRAVATAGGGLVLEREDPDLKIDAREETKRAEMADLVAINKPLFIY